MGLVEYGRQGETPLWLYVLREAANRHQGDRLDDVGGRIVAEVLIGIIARDPEFYLAVDPNWDPNMPGRERRFRLRDILVAA